MLLMKPQIMDVVAGVNQAKDTAINTIKPVVNNDLVPILAVVVAVVLLVNIFKCISHQHHSEEFQTNLVLIGICVVVLAVVISFPAWGWTMVG